MSSSGPHCDRRMLGPYLIWASRKILFEYHRGCPSRGLVSPPLCCGSVVLLLGLWRETSGLGMVTASRGASGFLHFPQALAN